MHRAALLLLLVACTPEHSLVEPPWPDDAQVVLLVLDESNDIQQIQIVTGGSASAFGSDIVGHRILAQAYPPANNGMVYLKTCGVGPSTGGAAALPKANDAWTSPVVADDLVASFQPTEERIALGLVRCEYTDCPRHTVEKFEFQPGHFRGLAFIDDDDIIVTHGRNGFGHVFRLRGQTVVWQRDYEGYIKNAAYDAAGTVYFTVSQSLRAIDIDGNEVATSTTYPDLATVLSDGVGGIAGRRVGYGLVSLDGAWPDLIGEFDRMVIVPRSGLAVDDNGVWRLVNNTWKLDLPGATFNRFGGDDEVMMAFSEVGAYAAFRDGEWETIDLPPMSAFMNAVTAHDGRFVLSGARGRLWFQSNRGWCQVQPQTGQRLDVLEVSPDGRTIIALGQQADGNEDDLPVMITVRLTPE